MRAEHEGRRRLGARGGGQGARDVGVLVGRHVNAADGPEVVREDARHVVLARRGGGDVHVGRVGLGVHLDITQEPLEHV